MAVLTYIFTVHMGSLFSTSPPACIIFYLFDNTFLTGVRTHLMVTLICISLTGSDVEHFFMCLLAICVSSFEKCLFRSSTQFLVIFLAIEFLGFLKYSGLILCQMQSVQIFSLSFWIVSMLCLLFAFLYSFLTLM
jgi:hypothetical protein